MTKDNIIHVALRLFLQRGYKYVSLVDVAAEAGITKGGIYHYFSSKEDLLYTAVHYLFDRIEAKYIDVFSRDGSLQQALYSMLVERELEVYARSLLGMEQGDYRENHASFILEVMNHFPKMQERIDRSHMTVCQAIGAKLQAAMGQGEIRPQADTHALAVMILAMLNGQISLGEKLNSPEIRKLMTENLWRLICA
ncbi:TetR/AcrR family transcriptional regulator [Propionispora hippei]|uniref:Transcriptional regulator, TetR family n=1 Tax=Propionispora hippei DSM 15287 TaxID=1123003 RepID=A0A1M6LED8_9FIRM|nr:TetR/AcrR family transcriptional regulator [Propionispora hippei]SHJ69573.1 transcriptional regulator, TetR family [Propionispora hippei DSM 15287]